MTHQKRPWMWVAVLTPALLGGEVVCRQQGSPPNHGTTVGRAAPTSSPTPRHPTAPFHVTLSSLGTRGGLGEVCVPPMLPHLTRKGCQACPLGPLSGGADMIREAKRSCPF